jgi:hypothetical protein
MLAPRHNQHVHEQPAQRRRQIDHERIHEELAQVSTDGLRRGRVGSAEIDEKNAGVHFGAHASGVLFLLNSLSPPEARVLIRHKR